MAVTLAELAAVVCSKLVPGAPERSLEDVQNAGTSHWTGTEPSVPDRVPRRVALWDISVRSGVLRLPLLLVLMAVLSLTSAASSPAAVPVAEASDPYGARPVFTIAGPATWYGLRAKYDAYGPFGPVGALATDVPMQPELYGALPSGGFLFADEQHMSASYDLFAVTSMGRVALVAGDGAPGTSPRRGRADDVELGDVSAAVAWHGGVMIAESAQHIEDGSGCGLAFVHHGVLTPLFVGTFDQIGCPSLLATEPNGRLLIGTGPAEVQRFLELTPSGQLLSRGSLGADEPGILQAVSMVVLSSQKTILTVTASDPHDPVDPYPTYVLLDGNDTRPLTTGWFKDGSGDVVGTLPDGELAVSNDNAIDGVSVAGTVHVLAGQPCRVCGPPSGDGNSASHAVFDIQAADVTSDGSLLIQDINGIRFVPGEHDHYLAVAISSFHQAKGQLQIVYSLTRRARLAVQLVNPRLGVQVTVGHVTGLAGRHTFVVRLPKIRAAGYTLRLIASTAGHGASAIKTITVT